MKKGQCSSRWTIEVTGILTYCWVVHYTDEDPTDEQMWNKETIVQRNWDVISLYTNAATGTIDDKLDAGRLTLLLRRTPPRTTTTACHFRSRHPALSQPPSHIKLLMFSMLTYYRAQDIHTSSSKLYRLPKSNVRFHPSAASSLFPPRSPSPSTLTGAIIIPPHLIHRAPLNSSISGPQTNTTTFTTVATAATACCYHVQAKDLD
jgi:hypothetical protein